MPPETPVPLAPHIHMARCGDDIVVLDVRADDYLLLADAASLIRLEPGGRQVVAAPEVRRDLLAHGLLADAPCEPPHPPAPGLTGEIAPCPGPLPGRLLVGAAVNSLVSTAAFARTPFAVLVERAARRRAPGRPAPDDEVARALAAFLAVHPWIPFEGDCLQRGWRLHHHLHRCDVDARWVFGVRTWPFLAHCWVQVGDRVVGDTAERVRGFSPILVV